MKKMQTEIELDESGVIRDIKTVLQKMVAHAPTPDH
jgi:hypothetical protein